MALAKQYFAAKELDNAKEQIDGYLENEGSGDIQGWLLKAAIYTAISKNAQWKFVVPDGRMEAFTSIKKATALDKQLTTNELNSNKFTLLLDIYQGYVTEGIASFNTATEAGANTGYGKALDLFRAALSIYSFANQQGWEVNWQPNLQSLQYNAAQAAINAGNEDAALLYSRQVVDAGIPSTGNYNKADFANIYQWLVNYYQTKQDDDQLYLYASLGQSNYPDNLYFITIWIDYYRKTADYKHLWATYEETLKLFPTEHKLLYQYSSDLFTYIYKTKTNGKITPKLYREIEISLKQYLALQPDSVKGYWLIGKYYFNRAVDLQKAGAKPDSIKWNLNQAVVQLQTGMLKCIDCDKALIKEIQLTICKALKAMGHQEAEMCYDAS